MGVIACDCRWMWCTPEYSICKRSRRRKKMRKKRKKKKMMKMKKKISRRRDTCTDW